MHSSLRSSRALGIGVVTAIILLFLLATGRPQEVVHRWTNNYKSSHGSEQPPQHNSPTTEQSGHHEALPAPVETTIITQTPQSSSHEHDDRSRCRSAGDHDRVVIGVKTGATEAVDLIPMLMTTSLRCAKDVMIFSDLEQDIAGYHIRDALASIPQSAMDNNSDFDFYKHLKEALRYGQIEAMLREARDPRTPQDLAAWTLDKYKFLHILEDMFTAHPDKEWYMLIDADTYIVWDNLLHWLQQLPNGKTEKHYYGSPAQVNNRQFAHGGSGILISHAAMQVIATQDIAASWDIKMHEECCGDLIIGDEFHAHGIGLKASWPTINGEKPSTLPFGPTHWCQPVVTMHHVHPNEMNHLTNFELSRSSTKEPLIFADLYNHFTRDVVPDTLINWDNHPRDAIQELDTYEECEKACQQDAECFQFNHHGQDCALGHSIHIGEPKPPEGANTWRSGWLKDRIKTWTDSQPPCEIEFPWT